jgi:cobalt-zinc-cadmium efflux system outer membrane protein
MAMSFNDGWQRMRSAALAVALVILLGARPSIADGETAGGATADRVGSAQGEQQQTELTLRDALALALQRSPDLASFSWETRAREARALQAGLRPNPIFMAEVENIGGSGPKDGVESAETTLLLSQLIELGGKRAKRRSLGEFEVKVAEWEYEAARLGVVGETTAAFVDALARQEAVRLADDQIRLAQGMLRAVEAQVRAGAVSSAEVPRAEVEVTKQQIERRLRVRARHAAYVRLATAWGESEPAFETLAGDLSAVSPIPLEAELVGRLSTTPELARRQAEVTKRRAAIELEDARRIPDVTLGLGPRHFNDTNDWALVVEVEVPLPVFDRNQGARRASRDELAKSREDHRRAALRLRRALARTYQDLASASDEVAALREDAIPIAERAYEAMKRAQRQGALRFTEVLDAQRSLFALRTQLVAALASYHISRARTEALVGGPLMPEKDPTK